MASAQEKVVINRSVGEVWAFHTEPTNIPRISVNTKRYEPLGQMARGCRILGATRVVGLTVKWEAEVVEFVELHGYTLRALSGPMPWTLSYRYAPSGGATVVTATQTAENLSGFFGSLAENFIVKRYQRDLASNLANLKQMVEAQPTFGF